MLCWCVLRGVACVICALTGVRRFTTFYGEPVAYLLSQCLGKSITFHINPPTVTATGEPDFIIYLNHTIELLRGEGKVRCQHCTLW